ncbi:MAG: S-formylglutathione hydrolase, partial [Gammaproteobacteria bacterium]
MTIENLTRNRSFDGWNKQYRHASSSLQCDMRFAIYLPPQA